MGLKITLYGGYKEVGGNKILLEDGNSRIWLDFGMSFSIMQKYFSEFLKPRKVNGLGDFFEFGLLPDLEGLYRCDFLVKSKKCPKEPDFDAVFLSHAHLDHSGHVPFLHRNLPVYCSKETFAILSAMQTTRSGFDKEFLEMSEHFKGRGREKFYRNLHSFKENEKIKVKDVDVIPFYVDHTIPGSCGFLINTSSGAIAYTGDFRLNGWHKDLTKKFVEKLAEQEIKLLICEGTRIDNDKLEDEEFLFKKLNKAIGKCKGLVVANFPQKDVDRMLTFYKAAIENDRKLVINLKQALLLECLKHVGFKVKFKDLLVYAEPKKNGWIAEEGIPFSEKLKDYFNWEKELLRKIEFVTFKDVREMQQKVVFYCDSWSLGDLVDVKPVKDSLYIYSLCEPFTEEMEIDHKRLLNWIKHFKLDYMEAHVHGHISGNDLRWILKEVKPEKVLPVHTERMDIFKKISGKSFLSLGEDRSIEVRI